MNRNQGQKNPLYRKVNTLARGVHHLHGGDYRNSRRKDSAIGMRKGFRRGLDYTPLFKFLLSKVGQHWDGIYSEAVSRLDEKTPIFRLVSLNLDSAKEIVQVGESSYFSGLFVDGEGILRVVNPNVTEETLRPLCNCCTHTFNGVPFTQRYSEEDEKAP